MTRPGPRPSIPRDVVASLHADGLTDREIAHELAANADYIARLRKRMGLPRNYRPGLTADEAARASALLADGASLKDVAETLGRHRQTIAAHFPGRGWTRQEIGSYAVLSTRHAELVRGVALGA